MKKKKNGLMPIWIVFLVISLLFLWLAIESSVIYKASNIETVSTYVYEKDITNSISIRDTQGNYILDYNHSTYTISKDRDTTIAIKSTSQSQNGISKDTRESLVFHNISNKSNKIIKVVKRDEIVNKDSERARKISRLSISHFILIGIPSYIAALIFLIITILTFAVWKDSLKQPRSTYEDY